MDNTLFGVMLASPLGDRLRYPLTLHATPSNPSPVTIIALSEVEKIMAGAGGRAKRSGHAKSSPGFPDFHFIKPQRLCALFIFRIMFGINAADEFLTGHYLSGRPP